MFVFFYFFIFFGNYRAIGGVNAITTGVDMVIIISDINFERKTFSLNFKKVPVKEAPNDAYTTKDNNETHSIKMMRDVPFWKGVMGNGEIQSIFTVEFADNEHLIVTNGESSPAFISEPFVSSLF